MILLPHYEIIDVNGIELIKGNDYINKKIFDIIKKSLEENKIDESKIINNWITLLYWVFLIF